MDVAVENSAYDPPLAIYERGAGVAADDVVVGRHIERCREIEVALRIEPALRQAEGLTVGCTCVQTAEVGEWGHCHTLIRPALNAAVGKPQGEGGIRIHRVAKDLEPRARQLLLRLRD